MQGGAKRLRLSFGCNAPQKALSGRQRLAVWERNQAPVLSTPATKVAALALLGYPQVRLPRIMDWLR